MKTIHIIMIILGAIILLFFILPEVNKQINDELVCYQNVCVKTTLDQFKKCIDLGVEDTGFLSSEHYYLCDNVKVAKSCMEYGKREVVNYTMLDVTVLECENILSIKEEKKE